MPNNVLNSLFISIDGADGVANIRDILLTIQDEKKGIGTIDFNKIVPMPGSLNIESGERTCHGMQAYQAFVKEYYPGNKQPDNIPMEAECQYLRDHPGLDLEEWELGRTAYQNEAKYGTPTWYEWCWENWGTKWNATASTIRAFSDTSARLEFFTATASPTILISRFAQQHPELHIEHRWADEDLGENCAVQEYKNGERVAAQYLDGSKALKFAHDLWEIPLDEPSLDDDGEWER